MQGYDWSATCQGPSVSPDEYLLYNDRIFLFGSSKARSKFLVDLDSYIAQVDERWEDWYGSYTEADTIPANTGCFH